MSAEESENSMIGKLPPNPFLMLAKNTQVPVDTYNTNVAQIGGPTLEIGQHCFAHV